MLEKKHVYNNIKQAGTYLFYNTWTDTVFCKAFCFNQITEKCFII